jgi:hypothetical protein
MDFGNTIDTNNLGIVPLFFKFTFFYFQLSIEYKETRLKRGDVMKARNYNLYIVPLLFSCSLTLSMYRRHVSPATLRALQQRIVQRHLAHIGYQHTSNDEKIPPFLIVRNIHLLYKVPGFDYTLREYLKQREKNTDEGHFYELKVALDFANQPEENSVVGLNQVRKCPETGISREFDVIVQHKNGEETWIECKTCQWKNFNKRQQLIEQQQIAQKIQESEHRKITYAVFSQHPVSNAWRDWLKSYNIPFYERR